MKAQQRFQERSEEVTEKLARIQELAAKMQDNDNPNWAHIGDMARLASAADEILEWLEPYMG